jgi:IclR family KDG regulon transcriptional repressor
MVCCEARNNTLEQSVKSRVGSDSVAPTKSLAVAMKIFASLGAEAEGVSVSELSRRLGRTKSQISRVLNTLRQDGFVERNGATRRYKVGLRTYALGCRYLDSDQLTREGMPLLRGAVDRTGYTGTLCVLDGARGLFLVGVEGSTFVDFGTHVGRHFPVLRTTPGKILYAFSDAPTREKLIAEAQNNDGKRNFIARRKEFDREVEAVLRQGYATSHGDFVAGIGAIAVPVFAASNQFVASFSIVYPSARIPPERQAYYAEILHGMAGTLSRRLGASSYPYRARAKYSPELGGDRLRTATLHER